MQRAVFFDRVRASLFGGAGRRASAARADAGGRGRLPARVRRPLGGTSFKGPGALLGHRPRPIWCRVTTVYGRYSTASTDTATAGLHSPQQ